MCQKATGGFFGAYVTGRNVSWTRGAPSYFLSSNKVKRGFCGTCGSSLFWDPVQRDFIAVAMGALDSASGTHLAKHIFTAEKGDYYDIADGLPQNLR